VQRFQRKPAWDFSRYVADPRDQRGRRWSLNALLNGLLLGLMTNRGSLRGVERLTELGGRQVRRVCARRVPDTTLYNLVAQLQPAGLRAQLQAQIHSLWRSKSLAPVGLPCGVAAMDGKSLLCAPEIDDPHAQRIHPPDRPPYENLRVVRTVLISSAAKVALDQLPVPGETNEMGIFGEAFRALEENCSALYEILSVDAGFGSEKNMRQVHAANKGYLLALKDNQPELRREAAASARVSD
jgi:hypothetical protein